MHPIIISVYAVGTISNIYEAAKTSNDAIAFSIMLFAVEILTLFSLFVKLLKYCFTNPMKRAIILYSK